MSALATEWAAVEIDGGIVTGGSVPAHGRIRYFIDIVEHDGGRLSMWDGESYDAACEEAAVLAEDFGVPVVDKLREGLQ